MGRIWAEDGQNIAEYEQNMGTKNVKSIFFSKFDNLKVPINYLEDVLKKKKVLLMTKLLLMSVNGT